MSLSQTWSVGPVALTISVVGDPAPTGWAPLFAPIVEAVEEALASVESDVYPIMRKGALVPSPDPEAPEDASPNGDAHTGP